MKSMSNQERPRAQCHGARNPNARRGRLPTPRPLPLLRACSVFVFFSGLALLTLAACTETRHRDPVQGPLGYQTRVVDDLEDCDQFNSQGGYWFTFDDRHNGGTSRVAPAGYTQFLPSRCGISGSRRCCARFQGSVTAEYANGYVGMGTDLARPNDPVDLRAYDGVQFWARGDGKQYRFKFRSKATPDYDDYGYTFVATRDWTEHTLDFPSLDQEGWGQPVKRMAALSAVVSMVWQTIGQPHRSVALDVDHIRLLTAGPRPLRAP